MKELTINKKAFILFKVYIKAMLFAFTGGSVTFSLLQQELDDKHHLIKKDDMLTCFAIGQTLPGVISLNAGIMIGRQIAGVKGIIAATAGIVLPAFFGMIFVIIFFQQLKNISWIQGAIEGIRVASVAIIFFNAVTIIKSSINTSFGIGIAITIAAFLGISFFRGNAVMVIVACGAVGIIYRFIGRGENR